MSLQQNLVLMEHAREAYWRKHSGTSELKLRWRAIAVRHCFHVLPGEAILEIGAGSGLWTQHLAATFRGENPVTAAVFNAHLAQQAHERELHSTTVALVEDLVRDLPGESFDYVVGTG